jgi:phosphoadenosine phosphosulfate reductase
VTVVNIPVARPADSPLDDMDMAVATPVADPVASSLRHVLADRPAESEDPLVDAHRVLQWANRRFGNGLVVTASFGDAVLAHVANEAIPGVEITLLDTGYLFAETEWYANELQTRF